MAEQRGRRRGTVWKVALVLVILAALVALFLWQQTGIQPEEITVRDSRLPEAFRGTRITIVADVHAGQMGPLPSRILEAVEASDPDLIAVVGDVVDCYHPDREVLPALAGGLAAIAPTYYVTGNHEWAMGSSVVREIKDTMARCGVTVLSNAYLTLEKDGQQMVLAGIDDPNGYADQKTLPELAGEIRADLGDPFILLLAHRNTEYEQYAQARMDLTLCGHAHGGAIRLPFTDGLISPNLTLFPDHTAGLYPLSYGQLVVSRGLGNSGPSFRLFNRPHLPTVTLAG